MQRFFIVLMFVFSLSSQAESLTAFTTDYCTNYPEGTPRSPNLWKNCCLEHDMFFWAGGSREERNSIDLKLRECVAEKAGVQMANIMYYAVRAGSLSPVKFPDKKWNNGWRERPDYKKLSEDDIDRIEAEILSGYSFIPVSLKDNFIQHLRQRSPK